MSVVLSIVASNLLQLADMLNEQIEPVDEHCFMLLDDDFEVFDQLNEKLSIIICLSWTESNTELLFFIASLLQRMSSVPMLLNEHLAWKAMKTNSLPLLSSNF